MGDEETVQLSWRMPAELAEALRQVAEDHDRTVSGEVRHIIRKHVTASQEAEGEGER